MNINKYQQHKNNEQFRWLTTVDREINSTVFNRSFLKIELAATLYAGRNYLTDVKFSRDRTY